MKLLLEDKIAKEHQLNANEACIYACIAKCTRAGRGWYGNYAALADAMPFEISYKTAGRAVQKLLTLGLIEQREEKLFTRGQNVPSDGQNVPTDGQNVPTDGQNVQTDGQNVQTDGQNVLPPITPLNKRVMNEKKKEEEGKTHVPAHDAHENPAPQFKEFMELFRNTNNGFYPDTENTACFLWQRSNPIKQSAMIAALRDPKGFRKPRPDWFISDFPDPQPQFLDGIAQDNARAEGLELVQVAYDNRFLICTRTEADRFQLPVIRIW